MAKLTQYLIVLLGEERYAINIGKINEIIRDVEISKVTTSLKFIGGLINIRNKVIPVVNLKLKIKNIKTYVDDYKLIITELNSGAESIAIMVDEVDEVVEIPDSIIDKPTLLSADYIEGVGKLESGMVIIIDPDKLFSVAEVKKISSSKSAKPPSVKKKPPSVKKSPTKKTPPKTKKEK
jgi:purine-binding chemotaxis protein CheW